MLTLNWTIVSLTNPCQGRIQKFQKGGGGGGRKPNSRKGGCGIRLFSAAFSHFLTNLLQIFHQKEGREGGGGAARPAPPLNPCLHVHIYFFVIMHLRKGFPRNGMHLKNFNVKAKQKVCVIPVICFSKLG